MAWRSLFIFGLASLLLTVAVRSASAFAVAPGSLDLSGNRGETVSSSVTIVNDQPVERTYYLHVVKFVSGGETGAPTFLPYKEDHSGLPDWIQLSTAAVRIPATSRVDVAFRVTIPSDALSGSYQAALVVSDAPSEVVAGNGASLQANIASLIFLTVEGETVEQAGLLDFSVNQDASQVFAGDVHYRVQNQGNVYLIPEGTVTFRDRLGHIVTVDANPEQGRVLPETTRAYTAPFGTTTQTGFFSRASEEMRLGMIGPVTATLNLGYGSHGQTLTATSSFSVWPMEMMVVIGGALVLLLLALILLQKRFKKK